jgi:guanyl-specific ribonuclease Sa
MTGKGIAGKCFRTLTLLCLMLALASCSFQTHSIGSGAAAQSSAVTEEAQSQASVLEGEAYTSKEEVTEYLKQFHQLPPNYITKHEAMELGWDSAKGNLWEVTDHQSIGGDSFGNREGLLPQAEGRRYFECDINYQGGNRGAERLVYSNDGLIFYTSDHYRSFIQIE